MSTDAEVMCAPIENLLAQVDESGLFTRVTGAQFEDLCEEGWLPEVEDALNTHIGQEQVTVRRLSIPQSDADGLRAFAPHVVEHYNQFDIALKDRQRPPYLVLDMIDYDAGEVFVFRISPIARPTS